MFSSSSLRRKANQARSSCLLSCKTQSDCLDSDWVLAADCPTSLHPIDKVRLDYCAKAYPFTADQQHTSLTHWPLLPGYLPCSILDEAICCRLTMASGVFLSCRKRLLT